MCSLLQGRGVISKDSGAFSFVGDWKCEELADPLGPRPARPGAGHGQRPEIQTPDCTVG